MKNALITNALMERMATRLEQHGMDKSDVRNDFDLVRTGFVNSMEFVEIIAELEKKLDCEINYEKALESDSFTTVEGIVKVFEKYINEKS